MKKSNSLNYLFGFIQLIFNNFQRILTYSLWKDNFFLYYLLDYHYSIFLLIEK